jgi:hypothetical protein
MSSQTATTTRHRGALTGALITAGVLALVGLFGLDSIRPALAAPNMHDTLRSYERKIKKLDPSVRDVKVYLGSQASSSACMRRIPANRFIAFYCPRDRGIFLNDHTIDYLHGKYGDPGLFYIMAHELAHGRQHAVTGFSSKVIVVQTADELQADCLSGAYLTTDSRARPSEKTYLAMRAMAKDLGDYHLGSVRSHGTPEMREIALQTGFASKSPEGCLSTKLIKWNDLPGLP